MSCGARCGLVPSMRMSRSASLGLFSWSVLAALSLGPGLACSSASPVDMWITKDPDAGAGFKMPIREAGVGELDGGIDTAGGDASGTGGAGGDTSGTGGAGGDTSGAGGTSGSGGGAGVGGIGGTGGGGSNGGSGGNGGNGGSAGTGP